MSSRLLRLALTVCMDLLVLVAIIVTGGLVVRFFGSLTSSEFGRAAAPVLQALRLPLGLGGIKTPYGGVFDVDAALTAVGALFLEWVLAGIRRHS